MKVRPIKAVSQYCSAITSRRLWLVAVLVVIATHLWTSPSAAQAAHNQDQNSSSGKEKLSAPSHKESVPDLSGLWERRDDTGSGFAGGIVQKTGPASLTPEAKKIVDDARAKLQAGYIIGHASRYCQHLGMPFLMGQSPPIDIVAGKDEILIGSEQSSAARHIYTDGRAHPAPGTLEASTNGHSIGHWEGDTLVVDTVGFNDLGIPNVPGGGLRTSTSHLVERFHLFDGGSRLSITSTWDDPKVYLKPHTYEIAYYKDSPDTYVLEEFCDPSDPARGQSVIPPPQN